MRLTEYSAICQSIFWYQAPDDFCIQILSIIKYTFDFPYSQHEESGKGISVPLLVFSYMSFPTLEGPKDLVFPPFNIFRQWFAYNSFPSSNASTLGIKIQSQYPADPMREVI